MRPGQHNNNNNKNRNNRNRNRRHTGSSGGQGGGGSGANRVYDSNGPDVKLRGTAQTIAEKYMQLARDAHSSGDSVAAESYYQFADHYYRVWLAAQPAGQPLQFSRRLAGEEYDDEGNETQSDNDSDNPDNDSSESNEGGETPVTAENGESQPDGDGQNQGYQNRQNNRNFGGNNQNNRDGGNNRNFRQRWPRRNERLGPDGQPIGASPEASGEVQDGNERFEQPARVERVERVERPVEEAAVQSRDTASAEAANWEAPSFLKRPMPQTSTGGDDAVAEAAPAPRPRGRKPRVAAVPVEDIPQGD